MRLLVLFLLPLCSFGQFYTEIGVSPLTSHLKTSFTASPVLRMNDFELSAPSTYELSFGFNQAVTAGYRFPGSYTQGERNSGILLHGGAGYQWFTDEALESGEVEDRFYPVVGLKWFIPQKGVAEVRYQGNAIHCIFGFRF